MARVYVSSTVADLEAERKAVIDRFSGHSVASSSAGPLKGAFGTL
jgi:hypothetical protein